MDERVVPEPTSAVSTEFPGSGARTGLFSVLRVRNFRLLWIGEAISVLGDQVHFVALPWLVLQLTGDPLAMGSVLALAGIPRAVFMLVGGAFTDRFSPRTIMLLSNVARMILVGAMAALVLMGRIDLWMLYGFALVFGLIDAFFYPASIAIVPALLPQHQLQSGNALVQGTAQISVLLGPLLGGALIASFGGGTATVDGVSTADLTGTGLALALDALTFLISAVTLRLIHEPARRQPSDGATPANGVMQDILDGLKTAWNDVALRFVVLISAAINFLVDGPILIGIPVLADTRFAQGAAAFGIVMSAYGGGSLVGTLLAGSLPKPDGRRLGPLLMVIIERAGLWAHGAGLRVTDVDCSGRHGIDGRSKRLCQHHIHHLASGLRSTATDGPCHEPAHVRRCRPYTGRHGSGRRAHELECDQLPGRRRAARGADHPVCCFSTNHARTRYAHLERQMKRTFPSKKTKIVCTIGPATQSPAMLAKLLAAGMNIARINFAHGNLATHRQVIDDLRSVAASMQKRVAIMGDLPGPKIRLGEIAGGSIELEREAGFTLVSEPIAGDGTRASHSFPRLPQVVVPGDNIFLNDGYVQLRVERVEGEAVHCIVEVGGPVSSRKGMNLPGIDLGMLAFTDEDHHFLRFAAETGIDAVSQSFVQDAADIEAVRKAAWALNYNPFVIAKIERAGALDHLDGILEAVDGIMVARGDLGVEIPIEQVAATQKHMIARANRYGKPVITATHMLESMIDNRRPTRAEVTDVANAILDGTDCVMLSGETAVGAFPADAVEVMARIAAVTEQEMCDEERKLLSLLRAEQAIGEISFDDLVSLNVFLSTEILAPAIVFAPTTSGITAQRLARFRLPTWIVAFSPYEKVCQELQFTWGVWTVLVEELPDNWHTYARNWSRNFEISGSLAIVTEGTGTLESGGTVRTDVLDLRAGAD